MPLDHPFLVYPSFVGQLTADRLPPLAPKYNLLASLAPLTGMEVLDVRERGGVLITLDGGSCTRCLLSQTSDGQFHVEIGDRTSPPWGGVFHYDSVAEVIAGIRWIADLLRNRGEV